jgi:serine/threonine-protein kinase
MLAPTAAQRRRAFPEPPLAKSTTEIETLLELGQGGMATAYLARALGTGGFERLFVMKRLSAALAGNGDALQRFLAEARVAARLHHVNVVGTQQIGWDSQGPFILLDYVEGGSLSDLVEAAAARDERLPLGVVLRVALDVLAGLRSVHEATDSDGRPLAILHRDVSLENVLVGVSDGVARLSDFGVAKSVLGPSLTEPGFFVGKVLYFAPEYLLREPIGPSLDLYALGVALWLALTGDDPWPHKTDGQLARAIIEEGVPPLLGHRRVPPEIEAFVARACARQPSARFQSARDMASALHALERRFVASHAEVAASVERLLGAKLRQRRETVARLVPELAAPTPADESLEFRETVRDSSAELGLGAPEPHAERAPATSASRHGRIAVYAIAPLVLAALALSLSVLAPSPERAPNVPRPVVPAPPHSAFEPEPSATEGREALLPPRTVPTEPLTTSARAPLAPARRRAPESKRPLTPRPKAATSVEASAGRAPGEIARKNPYR